MSTRIDSSSSTTSTRPGMLRGDMQNASPGGSRLFQGRQNGLESGTRLEGHGPQFIVQPREGNDGQRIDDLYDGTEVIAFADDDMPRQKQPRVGVGRQGPTRESGTGDGKNDEIRFR